MTTNTSIAPLVNEFQDCPVAAPCNTPAAVTLARRLAAVDALDEHGCTFTRLHPNSKQPKGDAWQNVAYSARQAQDHLHAGGNVGVHGGRLSHGIVWLDLDVHAAAFLRAFPQLRGTVQSYRADAPDRRKFAVHVVGGPAPKSTAYRTPCQACDQHGHSHNGHCNKCGAPIPDAVEIELLSTGRQAAVIGRHPDGAEYELAGENVLTVTRDELAHVWRTWTGQDLPEVRREHARAREHAERCPHLPPTAAARPPAPAADSLLQRVLGVWDVWHVLEHFGLDYDTLQEKNGWRKLAGRGYGGLHVTQDGRHWHWFVFAEGGDAVDLWAWQTRRRTHLTGRELGDVLREMAQAAGLDTPSLGVTVYRDGAPILLDNERAFALLLEKFAQPQAYELARVNYAGRWGKTRLQSARAVMLAVLKSMQDAGRVDAVTLSTRHGAELANMGNVTVGRALRALQLAGRLERVDGRTWFDGDLFDESDEHLANMFDGAAWSLTPDALDVTQLLPAPVPGDEVSEMDTHLPVPRNGMSVSISETSPAAVFAAVVQDWQGHDLFGHAARAVLDEDTSHRLGRGALSLLAAVAAGARDYDQVQDVTGQGRGTISDLAHELEDAGLLCLGREGRRVILQLRPDWGEWLEVLYLHCSKLGRALRRIITHLHLRLERAQNAYGWADSGKLRAALDKLIRHYRDRLTGANGALLDLLDRQRVGLAALAA